MHAPVMLRWQPAAGATYYNVQVFRDGRKVLSFWPSRTSDMLLKTWKFNGKAFQLSPGHYIWYVWPGFGRLSDRHYGQVLGQSTFIVK